VQPHLRPLLRHSAIVSDLCREEEKIDSLKKELQSQLNVQNEIVEKNQQALNRLKQQSNEYNKHTKNLLARLCSI